MVERDRERDGVKKGGADAGLSFLVLGCIKWDFEWIPGPPPRDHKGEVFSLWLTG